LNRTFDGRKTELSETLLPSLLKFPAKNQLTKYLLKDFYRPINLAPIFVRFFLFFLLFLRLNYFNSLRGFSTIFVYSVWFSKRIVGDSVADPHHFDADPDPAFHFDADPDPDPDPGSGSYCQLGMVKKKFSILVNNKTQMG